MKKTLLSIFGVAAIMTSVAQPSPSWNNLQNSNFPIVSAGIKFLDAVDQNVVWAFGYDGMAPSRNYNWVARSVDGGANFFASPVVSSTVTPAIGDTTTFVFANMDAIDANRCWTSAYTKAAGGSKGGLFKTIDGGTNWTRVGATTMYTNTTSFLNLVAFVTPQVGITQGDGNPSSGNVDLEIWRTTDGGNTWTMVPGANMPNLVSGEYGLVNVYEKLAPSFYWMGTNKGRIYRSTDAGLNWSVATLPGTPTASLSVNDISFRDANNGVAYVFNSSTNPATFEMYNTTDGGATWTQIVTVDPNAGRNDICRIPGTNLFASAGAGTGNQLISYSNDNGVTWNNWGSTNIQYLTVDFVSPEVGWAGSFSDQANSSLGGIYKYSGASQNNDAYAAFTMGGFDCAPATVTVNNYSTGNPANTYTWTSFPPTAAFSSSTATTPTITFTNAGQYTITLTANNGTATSTFDQVIEVATCTGINDVTADVKFAVYPNPTSGTLNIKLADGTSNFKYTVRNILGATVATENIKNQDNVSINLANQAAGVYFVTIENNGKKSTQKIIVE